MKIAGHPIHLMMVHFPSALFPLDFLSNLGIVFLGMRDLNGFSFYGTCSGVLLGWVAAFFGGVDFLRYQSQPDSSDLVARGFLHGCIQTVVLIFYTLLCIRQLRIYPDFIEPSTGLLVVKGVAVTLLLTGNFLGGELMMKLFRKNG